MRVFKTTYKDKKSGQTRKAAKWYVEFRDHNEAIRRLPAFTSKTASQEMARNLEKLIGYHKGSGGQTDPALAGWLATIPLRTREKLVAIGLLDRERVAVSKPLSEHLDDFGKALQAKGNSPFHVEVVTGRARRVVEACGFRFYADIKGGKVMAHLHSLRADIAEKRGISAQTFNFYVGAVKQFCRWMQKDRRASENPVAHLDKLNVKTDRRHDRRALTVPQLVRLLNKTHNGPARCGMSGPERAMLYRVAVETGLRAGELRSLTRACFDLDAEPPTVTVDAAYSKRRRQDTLPLRAELATVIRAFGATMTPATQVFKLPTDHKTAAEMFQADLKAAGIDYRDDAGLVADFHALRHTFITNLASGGVHPKTAQALARHSTISLTMDRYTHSYREAEVEALAVLPDLSAATRQIVQATGTHDAQPIQADLASCLSVPGRFQRIAVDSSGRMTESPSVSATAENRGETAISPRKTPLGSVCTSGEGPGLQNQWGV